MRNTTRRGGFYAPEKFSLYLMRLSQLYLSIWKTTFALLWFSALTYRQIRSFWGMPPKGLSTFFKITNTYLKKLPENSLFSMISVNHKMVSRDGGFCCRHRLRKQRNTYTGGPDILTFLYQRNFCQRHCFKIMHPHQCSTVNLSGQAGHWCPSQYTCDPPMLLS